MRSWLVPILSLLMGVTSVQAAVIDVDGLTDSRGVGEDVEVLEDVDAGFSIRQVTSLPVSEQFSASGSATPSFGYTRSAVWVKLDFESRERRRVVLQLGYPLLDSVSLYLPQEGGGWHVEETGDLLPFTSRSIDHTDFCFAIDVEGRTTAYLRVLTSSSMKLPLTVSSESAFHRDVSRAEMGYGLFFGILIAMLIYNGLTFMRLRDPTHLVYCGYVASISLFQAHMSGYGFRLLWPDAVDYQQFGLVSAMAAVVFFSARFAQLFMNTAETMPLGHRILRGAIVVAVPLIVLNAFLLYQAAILISTLVAAFTSIACVTVGWVGVRRGVRVARFYTLAWTIFLLGVVAQTMVAGGILPVTPITDNAYFYGCALEVLLLSFALADRYKLIQEESLVLRAERERGLEVAVEERTLELQSQRDNFELAKEEADEANAQKTAFFRNVSHELRTPLTLLLTPLEEMMHAPWADRLEVPLRNARRLMALVNQLLDFQKLWAHKRGFGLTVVDLANLCLRCGANVAPVCEARGLVFRVTVGGDPLDLSAREVQPLYVEGELDALEKVIFNFLSNALKFTPPNGGIELALRVRGDQVRLSVVDTGPGIAENEQERIFEPFSQAKNVESHGHAGTGIGLAYVRELVVGMGGSVGVESTPGEGATFYAELSRTRGPRRVRDILIVDDDAGLVPMLAMNFGDFASVEKAFSVDQALELVERTQFKVVITDARMPGRDGAELLKHLAETDADTVRILLTGQADQDMLQRAVNEGQANRVWYKPVDLDEAEVDLKQMIAASPIVAEEDIRAEAGTGLSFDQFMESDEPDEHEDFHRSEDEDDGVYDSRATILVVDDVRDMRRIMADMLTRSGYRVATAESGVDAWAKMAKSRPDLVLTDWIMPKMSGPKLVAKLRADPNLASIPVVMVTARSDEVSRASATEIGVDCFLGKPFGEAELIGVIRNLLRLKDAEKEVRAALVRLEASSERELRRAHDLLVQSEKLSQLGQLVASIGHEMASPIMTLNLTGEINRSSLDSVEETLQQLLGDASEAAEIREYFDGIFHEIRTQDEAAQAAATKLKELTTALRTQSRMDVKATEEVDLNGVVREALILVQGRTKRHEVQSTEGAIVPIQCYRSRVGQVVTNLVANASDALDEKRTRLAEEGESLFLGRISVSTECANRDGEDGVSIVISDNGDGVPDEIRDQIFEQFFTTKPAGVGTGLGLGMCRDIIVQHGGQLEVSRDPSLGGARFMAWLPLRAAATPARVAGKEVVTNLSNVFPDSEHGPLASELAHQNLRAKAYSTMASLQKEEAQESLERAYEKLSQVADDKTKFFRAISHEIRTPLTLIIDPVRSLLDRYPGDLDLESIGRNTQRLYVLVNQLLDLQKIEALQYSFELVPVSVSESFRIWRDYVGGVCKTRRIELVVDDFEMDGPWLLADGEALDKVGLNFLSNAIKYTPEGGRIRVGAVLGESTIRIEVEDTGAGIPEENLEDVFALFGQVHGGTGTSYAGTGVGLALASELAERMAGRVGCESTVGEGSTFFLELDRCPGPRPLVDILLVDDDVGMLKMVGMSMSDYGTVHTASSALEAREHLAENRYRLIISDARMPGEDGASLLAWVKENEPNTKRILLTGQADEELLQRTVNESHVDYLWYKPVDWDGIDSTLREIVGQADGADVEDEVEPKPRLGASNFAELVFESEARESGGSSEQSRPEVILVVDDLREMRSLLSDLFMGEGYGVRVAEHGEAALAAMREERVDLVVSDWVMPTLDGPGLLRKIREDEELVHVPVVLLTASVEDETRVLGVSLGADAVLGKPFHRQELQSMVSNLLSLKKAERMAGQAHRQRWLAQMAAQLSHELNNPLNYISGSFESVAMALDQMTEYFEALLSTAGPDAAEALAFLRTKRAQIEDSGRDLKVGLQRSVRVVESIRGVTEVDGPICQVLCFRDVLKSAIDEVIELEGRGGALSSQWDVADEDTVVVNPYVLRQVVTDCLRWSLSGLQNDVPGRLVVKVDADEDERQVLLLEMDWPAPNDHDQVFRGDGLILSVGAMSVSSRAEVGVHLWAEHGGVVTLQRADNRQQLMVQIPKTRFN